jgi:tRNA nucleotidyltransferase (CCA-adding enzyme)
MNIKYQPKNSLEKFGQEIYFLLVENFPETYFVGGTVRDILLNRKVEDIDIATSAKPEAVAEILKNHFIDFNLGYKNLGVILALKENLIAAVATFRAEKYTGSRYPKITYIKEVKKDSERRDFTINSLYLSLKSNKILDFYKGVEDLKKKRIKFIGEAKEKINEDPLRIVRALRFALELNFKIEKQSFLAIKNKLSQTKLITKSRLQFELDKIKNSDSKKRLLLSLKDEKNLDKFFKTS